MRDFIESFNDVLKEEFEVTFDEVIEILPNPYEGAYTATPTNTRQIFETGNKTMAQNFIVEPIPSNYGLVAWNGSALTIS